MSLPAQSPAGSLVAGAVVAGRFRLEVSLGTGGMAEVWRAVDLATRAPIAVKVLHPHVARSTEAVERLRREGEVLAALDHPAIVRVSAYGELDEGGVFVAMELLAGETLGARMRRGKMEPMELGPVVAGICAGLSAAHGRGIVHRDLKPDNVFLLETPQDEPPRVKLLDFGISKIHGADRLTHTGEVLGTPRYMSPEQLGASDVDVRVDVYALGVILYEALATRPPFLAATPTELIVAILHGKVTPLRSLRPDLPAALEAVVMRAMARAREARYGSAIELAEAFLDASGATARRSPLPRAKGLRTQALGGSGTQPPAALLAAMHPAPTPRAPAVPAAGPSTPVGTAGSSAPAAPEGEALRAGTFSAFPVVDPGGATVRQRLGASGSPPAAAPAAAGRALPPTMAQPAVEPSPVRPMPARPAAPAPSGPVRPAAIPPASSALPAAPPPGVGRLALVAAGLLAGALSAAIAIGALWLFRASSDEPEAPPDSPPAAPSSASPPAPPAAPVAEPEPSTATREPSEPLAEPAELLLLAAAEPPGPGQPEPAEAPATEGAAAQGAIALPAGTDLPAGAPEPAPRPGRRRRSEAQPDSPAPPDVPVDPLTEASRALAAGDAAGCVAILDRLLASGGTPIALRRRGDCELRAGQRDAAIRDYQRFCRLVPDHPSVPALREQLAGMGLTCP